MAGEIPAPHIMRAEVVAALSDVEIFITKAET